MFLLKDFRVSRGFVVLSGCILGGITLLTRHGIGAAISKSAGRKPVRLLMVGADQYARRAVRRISSSGFGACRVVGYVRVPGQQVAVHDAVVYEFENLENVDPTQIDDVLIAVPLEQAREVQRAMTSVQRLCRPVRAIVDIGADLTIREKLYQFGRLQMLDIGVPSVDSVQYRVGKRIFDVAFASVALILAAPLIVAISIAVKLTSPGPVLFRQERVGLNGKLFFMLKFRSMRMAPANESDMVWTTENDPRRTALGTFLRKTSLDELPQFWNVLRGDMSVVGPRPERPHFVRKFGSVVNRYNYRHLGKVGITGWAQVNGLRGDTSIERRVQYDLEYLQNWSLMFDLRIVWLTIWSGMFGKNAY
jgi:Undecaprenyl-phosphate glucose phosphotransferase